MAGSDDCAYAPLQAQAAVDAASVRGSETAAAMERMRSAVETEVKAYRAQLEEELRAEAEDELRQRIRAEVEAKRHSPSSRADENRFQEDEALRALSNGRAAMLEETSKKVPCQAASSFPFINVQLQMQCISADLSLVLRPPFPLPGCRLPRRRGSS